MFKYCWNGLYQNDIFIFMKIYNKTKDWALVHDVALIIDIKVLKLG